MSHRNRVLCISNVPSRSSSVLSCITSRITSSSFFFFLNDPAPPEISPLPLHAPLPIFFLRFGSRCAAPARGDDVHSRRTSRRPASRPATCLASAKLDGPHDRCCGGTDGREDRKSTRLNSRHGYTSASLLCL